MLTNSPNKIAVNIEDEMKRSYMDYAMSVIIGRALPDVRDGLKPVHRRILHGMNEMGLASNRAYRKSAKIEATWQSPPSAEEIRAKDQARLIEAVHHLSDISKSVSCFSRLITG